MSGRAHRQPDVQLEQSVRSDDLRRRCKLLGDVVSRCIPTPGPSP